jgi:hypothetical protein
MRNPIYKSDLFTTPETLHDLLMQADDCSNPYHVVMLTMNFCHAQVQQEMNKVECVLGHENCTICV